MKKFIYLCITLCLFTACGTSSPAINTSTPMQTSSAPSETKNATNSSISENTIDEPLQLKIKNTPTSMTRSLTGFTIGIDPGHQAKGNPEKEPIAPSSNIMKAKVSSGAVGTFTKNNEYEITLAISKKLRHMLEEAGATVYMTRETNNVNISNIARAKMMNEKKVDLVLRIHADGFDDASVEGTSVLVPSGKATTSIQASSHLAGEKILHSLVYTIESKNRGIFERDDQTGFNWSTVPVCTIELGFLSNKKEDRLLATDEYQTRCAQGIYDGVVAYYQIIQ